MDQLFLVDVCELHSNQEIQILCLDRNCKSKQRLFCKVCQEENTHQNCKTAYLESFKNLDNWDQCTQMCNIEQIDHQEQLSYDEIFEFFEKQIEEINLQMRKYLKLINLRYTNLFQYESKQSDNLSQIKSTLQSSIPLAIKNITLNEVIGNISKEEAMKDEINVLSSSLKNEIDEIKLRFENLMSRLSFDKVSYNYNYKFDSVHNPFEISQSRKIAISNIQKPAQPSFHIIEPPLFSQNSGEITLQIVKKGTLGISLGIISTLNHQSNNFQNALGVDSESKYIYQCGNKGNCYLVDDFRDGWSDIEGIQFGTGDVIQITYNMKQDILEFVNTTRNTKCQFFNIQNLSMYKDYYSFFISSIGSNHEIKILY